MADKNYVVSLTVDDSGAVAAVNNMTTALDKADTSTQSLRAQLRQMQQQLANLDPNTEEFQKLSNAAGKLTDQINDASEAVRANAGSAFEQLGNNAGLLSERLLNLDFEGAGQSVKALATSAKNLTFKEATAGLKGLTSGFFDLGKALLFNPLFLIGGVIALVITNIESLINRIPFLSAAFEAVGDVVGAVVQGFKDLTDWIGITENAAADAANKSIELQDETIKNIDRNAKRQIALARQNGKDVNDAIREAEQQKLNTYQKTVDDINKLNGTLTEDQIKARQAASDAIFDIETARIERQADQNQKDIEQKEAREKKAQEDAQKRAEDAAQKAKERRQKEKEQREYEAQFIAELYAEQDAQIEANNKELADRLAAIWQRANELSRAATQEQADEIKAIQDELEVYLDEKGKTAQELELQRLQDAYFEKKTLLENANKDTTAITEKYEAEQDAIKKKYADEDAARQQELTQKKIQFAGNALNAIAGLADAFAGKDKKNAKRNFQISKAFSIAQAGVNTALAATAALALKPSESLFPGQRFVEMGLAIAAGVAQIAKISSTKFNESGGDSGGGGGSSNFASMASSAMGSGGTVPTFNAMNLAMLQNRPEQTPKAYVLAQDVSSAVEARDKVRDLARIN